VLEGAVSRDAPALVVLVVLVGGILREIVAVVLWQKESEDKQVG
jgi:hypothetical protein